MDINEREENLCALEDKFLFHLDDLLQFLFPPKLQHPSAAGRLFTFAYHGPLVDGTIRTGPRGNHALAEYELAEMCAQFERENIVRAITVHFCAAYKQDITHLIDYRFTGLLDPGLFTSTSRPGTTHKCGTSSDHQSGGRTSEKC